MEKYKTRTSTHGSCPRHTLSTHSFVAEVLSQLGTFSVHLKTFMEENEVWGCSGSPTYKRCCHPPALSPKDSYKRELLQEKMWRLTLGKKQSMGRKPSKSAEEIEVYFLNLGAAISRIACSIAKSAPTQATKNVPCFPRTNTLTIYCISHITSQTYSNISNICQTDSSALLPFADKDSSFTKRMVFPYTCAAETCAAIPP